MSDAQVTIGADASAVERAANVAISAWKNAGTAITSAIGSASRQIIGDLANIATAQGKVNFASQHQSVRDFEQASARLAVSMGRDLEQVRGNIEATGVSIGKRPQEVTAWASEVGRLTYNFRGAIDAQKGLAGLAAETGRTLGDYRGLATELANVAKVGGDTTEVISVLAAQAEKLGVAGGVAAFTDQIEGLGDTISRFSVRSAADFEKVTALAGALGKGLNPQAAARAQQGAIGAIQSDPMRWERFLGRNLMDEHGQIPAADLPKIMQDIVEKTKRRFGSRAKRVLQMNFGNEAGAAMFNADYDEAAAAAGLAPSSKPGAAGAAYRATDAGKREVAEAQLAVSAGKLLDSSSALGRAADAMQQFAAKNPFTSTAMTVFASTAASAFASGLGGSIAKMMGQKGEGGAVGGAIDLLTKGKGGIGLRGAAGLGLAGAVLGAGLYGIEKFSEAGEERNQAIEDAGVAVNKNQLELRKKNRDARVNRLVEQGVDRGQALFVAEHEKDVVGSDTRTQADAIKAAVAAGIKDGMKGVKIDVKTRADTPVEVTTAGANQSGAGDQSGG